MYSKSRLAFKWVRYYFLASSSRGHGIHSPFVYDLVTSVLNDTRYYYAYEKIENRKKTLLQDERILRFYDSGAALPEERERLKKVSAIAASSISTQKFGRLLFRLANYYHAKTMVELGCSLGISTSYLALANKAGIVTTIEGAQTIAEIAKETFNVLQLENIRLINDNFDKVLDQVIASNPPVDLVFIDGNHRKKAVLEYFEKFLLKVSPNSLIIVHDIHWSMEMEEAWHIIQSNPKVRLCVDIFSAGLVFFREEFQVKQQFTIRF